MALQWVRLGVGEVGEEGSEIKSGRRREVYLTELSSTVVSVLSAPPSCLETWVLWYKQGYEAPG